MKKRANDLSRRERKNGMMNPLNGSRISLAELDAPIGLLTHVRVGWVAWQSHHGRVWPRPCCCVA